MGSWEESYITRERNTMGARALAGFRDPRPCLQGHVRVANQIIPQWGVLVGELVSCFFFLLLHVSILCEDPRNRRTKEIKWILMALPITQLQPLSLADRVRMMV